MQHPGWALVIVGGLIVAIGLAWIVAPAIPWLGHLPGDIAIVRGGVRIYFPLATCVVVSALLTLIFCLARFLSR